MLCVCVCVCVCVCIEASSAVSPVVSLVENVCCYASRSDDIAGNPSTLLQNPRGQSHCMLGKKLPAVPHKVVFSCCFSISSRT